VSDAICEPFGWFHERDICWDGGQRSVESKKFSVTRGFPENKLVRRQCGDIQIHEDLKVKLTSRCRALEAEIAFSKGPKCDGRERYSFFFFVLGYILRLYA
jgi:hypothetical protein